MTLDPLRFGHYCGWRYSTENQGYLARLIENPRVAKYLREHHREIALEFIRIVERQATAA
ncbi:MAG: hypothetical protein AB7I59_22725 [Geminicoccaceae bacterium]